MATRQKITVMTLEGSVIRAYSSWDAAVKEIRYVYAEWTTMGQHDLAYGRLQNFFKGEQTITLCEVEVDQ